MDILKQCLLPSTEIEMTTRYEPINDQDIVNEPIKEQDNVSTEGILLQHHSFRYNGSLLYFAVEDKTPYIQFIINGNLQQVAILSCKESRRKIEYKCTDETSIEFNRFDNHIQLFIIKNGRIRNYFLISMPFHFQKIPFHHPMISNIEKLLT